MSQTDPIADFLTRIRNGLHADHDDVEMPASTFKAELARILREQGYIEDFAVEPGRVGRTLRVRLKYTENRKPVIPGLQRVSKPGRRRYVAAGDDPEGPGRHGHHDHLHLARRDDRARRHAARASAASSWRRFGDAPAMSRIGKQPIAVPSRGGGGHRARARAREGPQGRAPRAREPAMVVKQEDGQIVVSRPTDRGEHRALHGLTRSLIANMVEGVTNGFEKRLEIQGVGYRAQLQGNKLVLALGYSHPVEIEAPEGIDFEVPLPTRIVVRGISKQVVGEVAANIRKQRPPEPYKGKGIRYEGEYVARKVGKRA